MVLVVRNLPGMQEMWVGSLGREDPLEEDIATHSNILAWRIPWTEEPGGLQSIGSQKSWTPLNQLSMQAYIYTHTHTHIYTYTYKDCSYINILLCKKCHVNR